VLVERCAETPTATTLVLDVAGWPGHLAGQHVDVRLTAEDGYQAARSYSLAAPADGDRVRITVQRLVDGEVSPFLVEQLATGDAVEVRGPLGGWFVWRAEDRGPVLLVAGGAGIVPLMAMIRARAGVSRAPFRLVCSVRTPEDRFYAAELRRRVAEDGGLDVAWVYTRTAPVGASRPAGRLRGDDLIAHGWPPDFEPTCYVCGPTGFVEAAANLLLAAGHDAARIRTERFGGA
jgi:ferredoxin-NADP reductase